jgi:hypothetical protein
MDFAEKLIAVQQSTHSNLALLMKPRLLQMPLPIQRYDDPFLPFGKAVINATRDIVCAYMFDLAAYMALGAAGCVALERTIAYVGKQAVTILHGPFVGPDYAEAAYENAFAVDAVTLADKQHIAAYLTQPERGVFVTRQGQPLFEEYDSRGGVYWYQANFLSLPSSGGQILEMRLAGETVLYASPGEDFADQTRAALEAMRI